ncbi:MAG: thiamine-phosphate kinase [Woeseiaceae bacterium]|jgi:thiamine-monophosphate kinase|nr:thiamine-phosphate kinase [Woeseiaceae bacterium]
MDEFELIRHYFDRKSAVSDVIVGIGDDAAILAPNPDMQQVQAIDTLVEGTHFLPQTDPADIAYRALAVNLSDIAAMGATPKWMTLALTLNEVDQQWIEAFANGLHEAADRYKVTLVGGDITAGPVVTVTISITGEIATGAALLRSGAMAGNGIYVTGTIGDAAGGLYLLERNETDDELRQRFLRPTPRLQIGKALVGRATAAIDISDGLIGDLNKMLAVSNVGAELDVGLLPISEALAKCFNHNQCHHFALSGGDDYELCFTANDADVALISDVTRIGKVNNSKQLTCRLNNDILEVDDSGYCHFK